MILGLPIIYMLNFGTGAIDVSVDPSSSLNFQCWFSRSDWFVVELLVFGQPCHLENECNENHEYELMVMTKCTAQLAPYLLFVLLNGLSALVQHHFLGQCAFFRCISGRLPGNAQFGNFTTRHALAQLGHLTTYRTIIEFGDFETSAKGEKKSKQRDTRLDHHKSVWFECNAVHSPLALGRWLQHKFIEIQTNQTFAFG